MKIIKKTTNTIEKEYNYRDWQVEIKTVNEVIKNVYLSRVSKEGHHNQMIVLQNMSELANLYLLLQKIEERFQKDD